MGDTTTRFALIGCGRIAHSHLEAISTVPEAVVSVIVEPREAAGKAAAERWNARWVANYDDPSIADSVDAVLVCSPPNTHFEITEHYLKQGTPVMTEKPLVIRSDRAAQLVALSAEKETLLMMASKFRYVDDVVEAKAIIECGILGDIILYENLFCSRVAMSERWNSQPEISGGGVLIDNGAHSVDIIRYLFGPIAKVQAQTLTRVPGLEVEDTAKIQVLTESGVLGTIDLSWSLNKESEHFLSVYGTEGTLHVGWQGSKYRIEGKPMWVPFGRGYRKVEALRRQLENFIAAVRGEETPLITAEDARASVQVVEAAYASAAQDTWHAVSSSATAATP